MKKWKIGAALVLTVVALVGSTTAYATGHAGGHHGWYARATSATTLSWAGNCWGDSDGDGLADTWNASCIDDDGDGICDLCGRMGYGYVDTDGNGICDNYETGRAGGGHHSGRHCRW